MIGGDGIRLGIVMRGDVPCVVLFCVVFYLGWRVVASCLFVFGSFPVLLLDVRPCMG